MKRKILFLSLSLIFIAVLFCLSCSADELQDEIDYYSYEGHLTADYLPLLNDVPVSPNAPWGNLHEKIGFDGVINADYIMGGYIQNRFIHDVNDYAIAFSGDRMSVLGLVSYGFLRFEKSGILYPPDDFEYEHIEFTMGSISSSSNTGALTLVFGSFTAGEFIVISGNWAYSNQEHTEIAMLFLEVADSRTGNITYTDDFDIFVYAVGDSGSFGMTSMGWLFGDKKILTPRDDLASFNFDMLDEEVVGRYYSLGYSDGYTDGMQDSDAYKTGYNSAVKDIDEGEFGANFLGNIFSAPLRALSSFTIAVSPNGTQFTLGGLLSCVIVLSLFVAFIKIFGGK